MRWRGALGHGVARSGAVGPERRLDRCTGEGRSDMAWRGAVRVGRSGDGPASRRRQRGTGVVEALEPSTGVSGGRRRGLAGPTGRPTAKGGGETGKEV